MRLIIPQNLQDEYNAAEPYLIFDRNHGKTFFHDDTPEKIRKDYKEFSEYFNKQFHEEYEEWDLD